MRVPREVREVVLKRAGYRCEVCGSEGTSKNPLTMHHVVPLCKGGPTTPSNLKCWCHRCHCLYHKRNGYPQGKGKKRRKK